MLARQHVAFGTKGRMDPHVYIRTQQSLHHSSSSAGHAHMPATNGIVSCSHLEPPAMIGTDYLSPVLFYKAVTQSGEPVRTPVSKAVPATSSITPQNIVPATAADRRVSRGLQSTMSCRKVSGVIASSCCCSHQPIEC